MLTFSLLSLPKQVVYDKEGIYNITLNPGYYDVILRGAQGGKACSDGVVVNDPNKAGGRGAKFMAILHQKGTETYKITVGSEPVPICNNRVNYAGKYGEGGNSGDDTQIAGALDASGAGGGYTAMFVPALDNAIVAMVGGGSGASKDFRGGHAGGRGYSYGAVGYCNKCFNRETHRGGKGEWTIYLPGSGGGGGYFGGLGGKAADDNQEKVLGYGGTSYYGGEIWINPNLMDGMANKETGAGYVSITQRTLCATGCNDCNLKDGNHCYACMNNFLNYSNLCYKSCDETTEPTYLSGNNCIRCLPTCASCTNGSSCTTCNSGHVFLNGICVPTPNPTPSSTPSNTPSITPSTTPSSTPCDTPSSTPSITPSSTPCDTPSSTPSDTPSSTPSDTPSSTPSDTPSSTPITTPSSTPITTPSSTPSDSPSIIPSISPSETKYDAYSLNLETLDSTQTHQTDSNDNTYKLKDKNASKQEKLSLGVLIAIIIGCIVLATLIILGIYCAIKNRNGSSDNCSFEEFAEETVIMGDETETCPSVTLDNPLFTTTVSNVESDIFGDDFDEDAVESYFHISHD